MYLEIICLILIIMTLEELCEKYHISESSVITSFPRTQKAIYKKYGIEIEKVGRGKSAIYIEKNLPDDQRALTMYQEKKENMLINNESLNLINFDFLVFLGIISTPMSMFRGRREDFLEYIGARISADNLFKLEVAFDKLAERDLITSLKDEDYIIVYIKRKAEKEMKLGIEMIQRCRMLAEKNNKRNWIPLLKVWLGMQVAFNEQPVKMDRLEEITGMSYAQIRDARKILESDEIFKMQKVYTSRLTCVGMAIDLNAFFND